MKKNIAISLIILATSACFAQISGPTGTDYERVIMQKGLLTVSEYFSIGELDDKIHGTIIVVTKVMANEKLYAFRLAMSDNGFQSESEVTRCTFDAHEIQTIIESLDYMIGIGPDEIEAPLSQVSYLTQDGTVITLTKSGTQNVLTIRNNGVGVLYDDTSKLYDLRSFFHKAKDKITELGGTI